MKMLYLKGSLFLLGIAVINALAENVHQAQIYQAAQQLAITKQQALQQQITTQHPSDVPGFTTDNPPETRYSAQYLTPLAKNKLQTDKTLHFVQQQTTSNNTYTVNPADLGWARAIAIATQADSIATVNTACNPTLAPCHAKRLPSPDFQRAVSNLSVVADASHDFSHRGLEDILFRGKHITCRYDGFDYNDCCRDKGWGQDLHLAGCNAAEKQLGMATEAGRCHKIGRYCDQRLLGICLRHKESSCCFNTKLARLVQEQGRGQLHLNWGGAAFPDCRGLTPNELQRLDFSRMDFSEFYQDIQQKIQMPESVNTQQRIVDKVNALYQQTHTP